MRAGGSHRSGRRESRRLLCLPIVLGCLGWAVFSASVAFPEEWAIVVHRSRQEDLERTDLVRIYLKQRRFWSDGATIVPINLGADTTAREAFTDAIFEREPSFLAGYWNRRYFQGVLPPITLASSEAVLRYVASDPRAIGYVPARLVDGSVQIVLRYEGRSD